MIPPKIKIQPLPGVPTSDDDGEWVCGEWGCTKKPKVIVTEKNETNESDVPG